MKILLIYSWWYNFIDLLLTEQWIIKTGLCGTMTHFRHFIFYDLFTKDYSKSQTQAVSLRISGKYNLNDWGEKNI